MAKGINVEEKLYEHGMQIAVVVDATKRVEDSLTTFFLEYKKDQEKNEQERNNHFDKVERILDEMKGQKIDVTVFQIYESNQKKELEKINNRFLPLELRLKEENELITKSVGVKEAWGKLTGLTKGLVAAAGFITASDFLLKAKDIIEFLLNFKK